MEDNDNEFGHTDRLFQLIEQRLQTAQQLEQLGAATAEAASGEVPDALLSVLGKKQNLIECLQVIQDELSVFQTDDPESRTWESPEKRGQCRAMLEKSNAILAEVTRQDEALLQQATAQREAIAAQLRSGQNEQASRRAYSSTQNTTGRVLDIGGV